MSDVQFDDLLAVATNISKEHEKDLKQRAARVQKEEARKRQEEERRQKSKKDAQAAILKLREEEEKRRRSAMQRQKLLKEQREQELLQRQKQQQQRRPVDRKPTERKPASKQPAARQNMIPERPKIVQDIPFDEIMQRAKQVPTDKKTLTMQKKAPLAEQPTGRARPQVPEGNRKPIAKMSSTVPSKSLAATSKLSTPPSKSSIYTSKALSSSSLSAGNGKSSSARDRLKNMALAPPQRLNTVKRDMRSVEEIQKDVRRQLGRPVQEERAPPTRQSIPERRPMRPSPSQTQRRPIRRSISPRPTFRSVPALSRRPPGHMPFRPNRSKQYSDEEEEDDDLDGFIDDGDEEDDKNNYSDVISKMFRYDRKRYRDEAYSDDDMEAGASDVLREESRSSRIARQEDLLEEQREREEMERAHKRKLARLKKQQEQAC